MSQSRSLVTAILALGLLLSPVTSSARDETFKGALRPENFDPSIATVVELEQFGRRLSGVVKIWPQGELKEGVIFSGEKTGDRCEVKAEMGGGERLELSGRCASTSFVGEYTFIRGRQRWKGAFRLDKLKQEKGSGRSSGIDTHLAPTLTACLNSNAACLIACPRNDYSDRFLCTNRCKARFASCKGRAQGDSGS